MRLSHGSGIASALEAFLGRYRGGEEEGGGRRRHCWGPATAEREMLTGIADISLREITL